MILHHCWRSIGWCRNVNAMLSFKQWIMMQDLKEERFQSLRQRQRSGVLCRDMQRFCGLHLNWRCYNDRKILWLQECCECQCDKECSFTVKEIVMNAAKVCGIDWFIFVAERGEKYPLQTKLPFRWSSAVDANIETEECWARLWLNYMTLCKEEPIWAWSIAALLAVMTGPMGDVNRISDWLVVYWITIKFMLFPILWSHFGGMDRRRRNATWQEGFQSWRSFIALLTVQWLITVVRSSTGILYWE